MRLVEAAQEFLHLGQNELAIDLRLFEGFAPRSGERDRMAPHLIEQPFHGSPLPALGDLSEIGFPRALVFFRLSLLLQAALTSFLLIPLVPPVPIIRETTSPVR